VAVSVWRFEEAAPGAIDSALDAALRTLYSVPSLFQVGLTVLGRPFREVDRLIRWPEGKGWVIGIREWGVGSGEWGVGLRP
jgi:hypothetical protein